MSHGSAMTRARATDPALRPNERRRIKDDFARARNAYLEAVAHICQLHDGVAQAKANIQQAKDNQKGIEAGWGAPSGKNKEERDAVFALWRLQDADWTRLQEEIAECQSAIADAEPKIERDEYDIRIARLDMEMAIAEMRVLAGLDEYRHER